MIDSAMAEVVAHTRRRQGRRMATGPVEQTHSKIEAQDWGEFEQLHTPDEKPQ